jgi:hypothetical protein
MKRIVILWVILIVVSQVTLSAAPRLSLDEVVRIADAEMKKHQQEPNAYQRPPGYNYAFREDLWRVFYNRKQTRKSFTPHAAFVVTVADKTKQTTFSPAK